MVEGVFDLPIATGGTTDTGTQVFWNPATGLAGLDGTVPGVVYCGVTIRPLVADDIAIRVLLNHPR